MDNDTEGSDDDDSFHDDSIDDENFVDDDKAISRDPFPDECQNEVVGIESFSTCLTKRYNTCPMFFSGSLSDCCQAAFSSTVIEDHRPVLVYIHYDKSMFSNVFCSGMFCSEIIIDYLNNNYIVWPWDITFESNKNTLIEIWKNLFSIEPVDLFSIEQCPMLIGITRRSAGEKGWASISGYEIESLLTCDILKRTGEKSTLETLLRELIIFKEKCDENEQVLSFDIVRRTGLSWEIVLEIAKYLTLNDIVKTFPHGILSLLYDSSKPEQIVSLRLNTTLFCIPSQLAMLTIFTNVISLTLLSFQGVYYLQTYETIFPKLIRLSLWCDNEVNFNKLTDFLAMLRKPISRFEIHCREAFFAHAYLLNPRYTQNSTIKYFLLDIDRLVLSSVIDYSPNHRSCFLTTIIQFIQTMINIRHVRLIISKYELEELLEANEWKSVVNVCHQLKIITLEVRESMPDKEESSQKAIQIQKILDEGERKVKFQVIFM